MMSIEEAIAFLEQACDNGGRLYSDDDVRAALRNGNDYIFRYSRRRGGMCMCSACGSDVDVAGHNHGEFVRCPECGKVVMIKDEWRGHKYLYDDQILYSWRRCSAEALIVVGIYCSRNFNCYSPESAQMKMQPEAIWQFEPGRARKFVRNYYSRGWVANCKGIKPLNYAGAEDCHTGMDDAIEGTRLGIIYQAIENNGAGIDLNEITAMGAIAKKGYIEYLCAAGQEDLAAEIAVGITNIVANPKAKNAAKLLGLTEGQWFEARKSGIRISEKMLSALRTVQAAGRMEIERINAEKAQQQLTIDALLAEKAEAEEALKAAEDAAKTVRGYAKEDQARIEAAEADAVRARDQAADAVQRANETSAENARLKAELQAERDKPAPLPVVEQVEIVPPEVTAELEALRKRAAQQDGAVMLLRDAYSRMVAQFEDVERRIAELAEGMPEEAARYRAAVAKAAARMAERLEKNG